jgi:hypothetical protein
MIYDSDGNEVRIDDNFKYRVDYASLLKEKCSNFKISLDEFSKALNSMISWLYHNFKEDHDYVIYSSFRTGDIVCFKNEEDLLMFKLKFGHYLL